MSFFNKIILIGRLVRDPEERYTLSGTPVTTFTIAVDRVPRKNAAEDAQTTDFFRVVTFGRLAEFARMYLTKGRLVLVEGEMRMRRWETQTGERRVSPEVVANVVRFMDRKPSESTEEIEEKLEIPEEDFSDETFSEDEPPF
ncbi:single-stranded DNA-binding protein [Thermotoga sp. KOL6]|uniref:single-stranded DNA-binding protein n=1 Tax=Thermotoga sp. KOL6 TaxID=126741 RepID=UPI000C77C8F6|nr:single-stranded DNA-binding protein [Thermotoga sp. KOL6]PLV59317.1 single-stranded DNA-binding protein [Thermotoga sp. KOL6]